MAADPIAVDLPGISAEVAVAYTLPCYYNAPFGKLEVKVSVVGEGRSRRFGITNKRLKNLRNVTAAVRVLRGLLKQAKPPKPFRDLCDELLGDDDANMDGGSALPPRVRTQVMLYNVSGECNGDCTKPCQVHPQMGWHWRREIRETLYEKSLELHTNMAVTQQALLHPQLSDELQKLKRQLAAFKGHTNRKRNKIQTKRATAADWKTSDDNDSADDDSCDADGDAAMDTVAFVPCPLAAETAAKLEPPLAITIADRTEVIANIFELISAGVVHRLERKGNGKAPAPLHTVDVLRRNAILAESDIILLCVYVQGERE